MVQSFAVLSAAGVGALSATGISIASSSASFAGVGSQSFVLVGQASATASFAGAGSQSFTLQGNANAVLAAAGLGSLNAPSIVTAFAAAAMSGTGDFSATMTAPASATLAATGFGVFAPILTAEVSATASMSGSGFLNGVDAPASEAMFTGLGTFSAVSYAFYADTETAWPRDEVRVAYVPWQDRNPIEDVAIVPAEVRETYAAAEDRTAVVLSENRVYYTQRKPRVPSPPNRRRKP